MGPTRKWCIEIGRCLIFSLGEGCLYLRSSALLNCEQYENIPTLVRLTTAPFFDRLPATSFLAFLGCPPTSIPSTCSIDLLLPVIGLLSGFSCIRACFLFFSSDLAPYFRNLSRHVSQFLKGAFGGSCFLQYEQSFVSGEGFEVVSVFIGWTDIGIARRILGSDERCMINVNQQSSEELTSRRDYHVLQCYSDRTPDSWSMGCLSKQCE